MKKEIINLNGPGVGLSGEFKYQLWNEDGTLAAESDWESNLITNLGLDLFTTFPSASGGWPKYYFIGSGTTPPEFSDIAMESLLPGGFTITNQGADVIVNGTISPWEYSTTKTKSFGPGVGTGTVNEFGIGTQSNGTGLFSHFAVTPGINKSASQTLYVSYRLTLWPSLIDVNNNSVSIGGELYDTATSWYYGTYPGSSIIGQYQAGTSATFWDTYDGAKATLATNVPSGDVGTASGNIAVNDTGGTSFRDCHHVWELNAGNTNTDVVKTATGINSSNHPFNTEFTAQIGGGGIPKDETQQLTLNWQLTWDRK